MDDTTVKASEVVETRDRSSEAMHTELTSFWQGVSTGWSTIFCHKPHVRSSSGTVTDGRKEERERR